MISHHIKGITVLYSYKHCVLGLLIVWISTDSDHVYRDIVIHCVFIRCVSGISHCTVIVGLFIIARGLRWVSALRGWGWTWWKLLFTKKNCFAKNVPVGPKTWKISKFFFTTIIFFKKCSWGPDNANKKWEGGILGCLGAPTRWVGKRYTSSFDHDPQVPWPAKIQERSALAFKSYRPETLAAEE